MVSHVHKLFHTRCLITPITALHTVQPSGPVMCHSVILVCSKEGIKINGEEDVNTIEDTSKNNCKLYNAVTPCWCGRIAHLSLECSCGSFDEQSLDFAYGVLHLLVIVKLEISTIPMCWQRTRNSSFDSMRRWSFGGPSGGGSFPGS